MSGPQGPVITLNKRFAAAANLLFSSSQAVFTIITGLVMVPIYLRHFDMSVYGAWLASGNVISMIALIEPGIGVVSTQKLAKCFALNNRREFSEIFGSALVLSCFFSLVVVIAGCSLAPFIPAWLNVPSPQQRGLTTALCFSSLGVGTSFIFYSLGAVPQALQRTVAPGVIGLFALSASVITILAGLHYELGVVALGLGSCALSITYVSGYLLQLVWLWRRFHLPSPTFSLGVALRIWQEAKLLLLAKIAGTIGKYLEAPVAAFAVSTDAAAVLVLTGRVLTAVQMFAERIGSAVFAGLSHISAKTLASSDLAVVREIIVVSTIITGMGVGFSIALSQSIISVWVGETAFGGISLLLLLGLSSFISSRKDLVSSLLVALGQIRHTSQWLAVEALLRVISLALFVFLFKVPGIPLAGAVAAFITLLGLNRVFLRNVPLGKEMLYVPGAKGCALSLGLGALYMVLSPEISSWDTVGVHSLFFCLILVLANLVDKEWVMVLTRTFGALRKGFRFRTEPV